MNLTNKVKNTKYNIIFHLSHIDLDGYGCQIITENKFGKEKIKYYNANYGLENEMTIKKIYEDVKKYKNKFPKHKVLFLITDINLSEGLCEYIDIHFIFSGVDVYLIDHHVTGKDASEKFSWYLLDERYCATKLTQMFFDVTDLSLFAEYINAQDLWQTSHSYFPKANYIADIAYKGYDFPWMLSDLKHQYKFFTIKEVFKRIKQGLSVRDIQSNFIDIQENFLEGKISNELLYNKNVPIEHKYVRFIYEQIRSMDLPIIDFNGIRGKMFYDIGANVFQQLSHMYNTDKSDVDFIFHVDDGGKVSLRSIGKDIKNNVSIVATKYFHGGGHFNSAGGIIFNSLKNQYEAIQVIESLIKK